MMRKSEFFVLTANLYENFEEKTLHLAIDINTRHTFELLEQRIDGDALGPPEANFEFDKQSRSHLILPA